MVNLAMKSRSSTVRFLRIANHLVNHNATSSQCVTSRNKQISVYDATMNYIDTENHSERAIVFLHGNPTSSYLWRNVIPHVSDVARCLAPDLIGMGKSSKIDGSMYTFQDHFKYLSKWLDSVNLPQKVNLVVHDWGSGLGFHWANLNRSRVESITHMESLVAPVTSWEEFPEIARKVFQAMRTSAGEEMVLQKNFFVERLLPTSVLRQLTEEEMETYKEPFKNEGESRRPTLTWPRQIPVATDGPDDVVQFAEDWSEWLASSPSVPKLYINAKPGFFSPMIKKVTEDWKNQQVVTVKGLHFIQEDSPDEIGIALRDFLVNLVKQK